MRSYVRVFANAALRRRRDLMGFDSLDIIFLASADRLIFRDSVASYTVADNGSDFYLLNSASRFPALPPRSGPRPAGHPRFALVRLAFLTSAGCQMMRIE